MTKVALLSDVHLGVRGDISPFHNNNEKFFSEIFFPYLKKYQIDTVWNLGDLFDNRRAVNVYSIKRAREYFFEPLRDNDINMWVIQGNHDLYYKQSNSTSSLQELTEFYSNITVIDKPTSLQLGSDTALLLPWITEENRQIVDQTIESTKAKWCFAHLELAGYQMYRHQVATHGDSADKFAKFTHVYSGHYHHKNSKGNVTYLGSNQQHTWADAGDRRGFHILDSDNPLNIEFVENPYDMFAYVRYGTDVDINQYSNKYIRVTHGEVSKRSELDAFVKQLEAVAYQVQIVPDKIADVDQEQQSVDASSFQDTVSIIKEVVTEPPVQTKLLTLYNQACNL